MIMFGLKFAGDVPFRDIYITGLIKDGNGQKMSKSKGNVLDPIDLIDGINLEDLLDKRTQGMMQPKLAEKIKKQTQKEFPNGIPSFGTDAIRFTFTALASFGRDIKFDLKRVEGYRNFCNKLWNASRFVLMNLESKTINHEAALSSQDKWILSRLQHVKIEVQKHLSDYRLDLMSQTLYEFVWHDYCDWYLELSKPLLENSQTKQGCESTLIKVLTETLVLLHPIIPFITEEIFEQSQKILSKSHDKLISQPFPEPQNELLDDNAEAEINWLKDFILGIRKIRGEMNLSPGKPLPCFIKNFSTQDKSFIESNRSILTTIAKLDSISLLSETDEEEESAIALVGEMKLLIPLAGLIDKGAEQERLNKEIEKLLKLKSQFSAKLSNEKFVKGAPEAVVNNEKQKLASTESALNDLESQLEKISNL
jgi:valyl-tRNA synthetase